MMSTVTLLRAAARFFTGILIQVQVKSQPLFPIDQIFRYGEVHEWSLFLLAQVSSVVFDSLSLISDE